MSFEQEIIAQIKLFYNHFVFYNIRNYLQQKNRGCERALAPASLASYKI